MAKYKVNEISTLSKVREDTQAERLSLSASRVVT